jgi:hypothetical protein
VASLAVGLASSGTGHELTSPTVENRGPRGLAVLFTWLAEAGRASSSIEPAGWVGREVATVVLAAPTEAELDADEVDALRRHVEGGGTLVYLASRDVPQPALHRWLGVVPGATPPLQGSGAVARVLVKGGALAEVDVLAVHAERMVALAGEGAVAVAEWGALWWKPVGQGEVWVGAGPDLAENAALAEGDNARFWAALAGQGKLVFLERQHLRSSAPRTPLSLTLTLLQLGLVALAFVAARGSRLGPAREPPPRTHRSTLEYVEAMARLTQRARVEPELVEALKASGMRLARERLVGPPRDGELIRWLRGRDADLAACLEALGASAGFLEASRHLAQLQHRLPGPRS